jgi:hypothetical protein
LRRRAGPLQRDALRAVVIPVRGKIFVRVNQVLVRFWARVRRRLTGGFDKRLLVAAR